MVRCYRKMHDLFWSKNRKDIKKIHKEIAALICHQEGKLPYAAILGTGTIHRDCERCAHEGWRDQECNHVTCDGHAESIVYEGAPKYFMDQMVHLVKEGELGDSIFEKISSTKRHLMFRLKPNIKFYLMVTDPPCGFIQNQENPCMEWKTPFVGFPHVPTCSSRILIGAKMGIQGFVSHLLDKRIFIDSIIVLCTSRAESQRTDFGNSFPLPKIKTFEYNPNDFKSFRAQNLIKSQVTGASNYPLSENNEAKSKDCTSEGTKHTSLAVGNVYKDEKPSYLIIDVRNGKITDDSVNLITNKSIDDCLTHQFQPMDESEKEEVKSKMKNLYTDLCKKLNLEKALLNLQDKLVSSIKRSESKIKSWWETISKELDSTTEIPKLQSERKLDKEEEIWKEEKVWKKRYETDVESMANAIKNEIEWVFKYKVMLSNIERILSSSSNESVIIDCTWNCYFKSPDDNQPTDN